MPDYLKLMGDQIRKARGTVNNTMKSYTEAGVMWEFFVRIRVIRGRGLGLTANGTIIYNGAALPAHQICRGGYDRRRGLRLVDVEQLHRFLIACCVHQ